MSKKAAEYFSQGLAPFSGLAGVMAKLMVAPKAKGDVDEADASEVYTDDRDGSGSDDTGVYGGEEVRPPTLLGTNAVLRFQEQDKELADADLELLGPYTEVPGGIHLDHPDSTLTCSSVEGEDWATQEQGGPSTPAAVARTLPYPEVDPKAAKLGMSACLMGEDVSPYAYTEESAPLAVQRKVDTTIRVDLKIQPSSGPSAPGTLHAPKLGQDVPFFVFPSEDELSTMASSAEFVPPRPKDQLARVFIGQLPDTISERLLQWIGLNFGGGTRLFFVKKIPRASGCFHAHVLPDDIDRLVVGLDKKVLMDQTGVWATPYAGKVNDDMDAMYPPTTPELQEKDKGNLAILATMQNYINALKADTDLRFQGMPWGVIVTQMADSSLQARGNDRPGDRRGSEIMDGMKDAFTFVPVCPEIDIGFGVPRPTLRLVAGAKLTKDTDVEDIHKSVQLWCPEKGQDYTEAMDSYTTLKVAELRSFGIDGFILKRDSPSCGIDRVKLYESKQELSRGRKMYRGLFARGLMREWPELPVTDEGRLTDEDTRNNFVASVLCHQRWRSHDGGFKAVINFHAHHKYTLMVQSPKVLKELGSTLAKGPKFFIENNISKLYYAKFFAAMKIMVGRGRHTNVLLHLAGHLKNSLDPDLYKDLLGCISDYQEGMVPLVVPLHLLQAYSKSGKVSDEDSGKYLLSISSYVKSAPRSLKAHTSISNRTDSKLPIAAGGDEGINRK